MACELKPAPRAVRVANDFAQIDILPGSITRLVLVERPFSSRDFLKVLFR